MGLAVMVGGAQFETLVSANIFVTAQTAGGFRTGFGMGMGVSLMGILAGFGLAGGLLWENWRWRKEEGETMVRNTL